MKEKIYDIIVRELDGEGFPAEEFSLLKYLTETGSVQGGDGASPADGEFDAVMIRLPRRIKQPVFVNLHVASRLKNGIRAQSSLSGRLTPGQKKREDKKAAKIAAREAELALPELSAEERAKLSKRLENIKKRAAIRKERREERLTRRVNAAVDIAGKYEPVTVADQVISFLDTLRVKHGDIRDFGTYLCENSCTTQAAKLGLAMLGFFGDETSKPLVKSFCGFEEFTYFALKTLKSITRGQDEFTEYCVTLLEKLSGWGKVAAILELPDRIDDENLRTRILAHGAGNNIGLYIIAAECAIKGGLKELMLESEQAGEPLDKALADGICNIFDGLFQAEKIKDADSFSEVPDMGTTIASFKEAYRNGAFDNAAEAPRIAKQLKERF